jgi:hypothetical protein
MKQIKKIQREAREVVAFWCACGCPAQFRPRRALRRLAFFRLLRVGFAVVLVLLGPWLLALLVRFLF